MDFTPKEHPDYKILMDVQVQIQALVDDIIDKAHSIENERRILDIQDTLDSNEEVCFNIFSNSP